VKWFDINRSGPGFVWDTVYSLSVYTSSKSLWLHVCSDVPTCLNRMQPNTNCVAEASFEKAHSQHQPLCLTTLPYRVRFSWWEAWGPAYLGQLGGHYVGDCLSFRIKNTIGIASKKIDYW